MKEQLDPYKTDFPDILDEYIKQIKDAIKRNKHHDYRRHLFIDFLRKGFDIEPAEIDIEKKIKCASVRGNIDAFFKNTIFEFKCDLDKERPAALLELRKYFNSQSNPNDLFALLSDGIFFEIYQYKNHQPEKIGDFKLGSSEPIVSFRYLDQFIFSSKPVKPESEDIVQRFGLYSAIFNYSSALLKDFYLAAEKEESVKTKFREWNTLLSRVYGDELGDTNLFLRHTYLTMLSRVLIAKTLFPHEIKSTSDYKGLLTGEYFSKKNISNLVEPDFFGWAIDTTEETDFIGYLSKLEGYLNIYDLSKITEDILKNLYQELVDPESRHALGEYYTPDWLAELTLREINYQEGIVLDPACGSGTFLFKAIQAKRRSGRSGNRLLEDSLNSIIGIDVHPVAVVMSKTNMVLALNKEIKTYNKEIYLKVYLSDTLLMHEDPKKNKFAIPVSKTESFFIPVSSISMYADFDQLIDKLSSYAHKVVMGADKGEAFKGLERTVLKGLGYQDIFMWKSNFDLLVKLIKHKRNTIWSYILKNIYRPAFIRFEKADYIVGNPPWLAYRYINETAYKQRVKELTLSLGLLESKDTKLFTQMDTSTLFYRYCEKEFLKENGTIAFVMPKTTILPAKQHMNFQSQGVSRIYDFSGVTPLFNVRAVLVVCNNKDRKTKEIPITYYEGNLKEKNISLQLAEKRFSLIEKSKYSFLEDTVKSPDYHTKFLQGATIVPRCFWFVSLNSKAAYNADTPYMITSDEALNESKKPWQMKREGRIEKEFLYETILAKGLLPFSIKLRELIFLPLVAQGKKAKLISSEQLLGAGKEFAAQWMQEVEKKWIENRSSEDRDIYQRLNYNNTLESQLLWAKNIVIYNTSGTNLTAALVHPHDKISGLPINGFVSDAVTYFYYPKNEEEGHFLSAILNSTVVNNIIKEYQPQGLFGARHIHRRPFEACPIPLFNEQDKAHLKLFELGREARIIAYKYAEYLEGPVGRMRTEMRRLLRPQLEKINELVEKIFKEQGMTLERKRPDKKRERMPELFGK